MGCTIVAEIGINHNGDLDLAKRLIDIAVDAQCDVVKFQKRTPEICVAERMWDTPRDTPFGRMTHLQYRRFLEFDREEYDEIDAYCKGRIPWTASVWDESATDFMEAYDPPFYKIASASLTDDALLRHVLSKGKPITLSIGGSTFEQIEHAYRILDTESLTLLHTCSAYPAPYNELNLRAILGMIGEYGPVVGYSGHETGIATSVAAVALGACVIERHITIDRAIPGSDQAASLAPHGLEQMVRDIRLVEEAMGDGVIGVTPSEIPVMAKLRRK
jgi:N-acetylneuraminate synthase